MEHACGHNFRQSQGSVAFRLGPKGKPSGDSDAFRKENQNGFPCPKKHSVTRSSLNRKTTHTVTQAKQNTLWLGTLWPSWLAPEAFPPSTGLNLAARPVKQPPSCEWHMSVVVKVRGPFWYPLLKAQGGTRVQHGAILLTTPHVWSRRRRGKLPKVSLW